MAGRRPKVVDLFSGVGGFSLGFRQAGYDVALAVDNYTEAIETYERNFPNSDTAEVDLSTASLNDIFEESSITPEEAEIVIGGPPCQGFSLMGNRDPNDDRNNLLLRFAKYVTEINPEYFVMENVQGLASGDMVRFLDEFKNIVSDAGFELVEPIDPLNVAKFGIPQNRKRIIALGYKEHNPKPEYPEPEREVGVWTAIRDIPSYLDDVEIEDGTYHGPLENQSAYVSQLNEWKRYSENIPTGLTGMEPVNHTEAVRERFGNVDPGNTDDVSGFKRLHKEEPANTLRAGSSRERGTHTPARPIHPVAPRAITVREAARIQSFPDWFQFHDTKYHGLRLIGNSVPPKLAKLIADQIKIQHAPYLDELASHRKAANR